MDRFDTAAGMACSTEPTPLFLELCDRLDLVESFIIKEIAGCFYKGAEGFQICKPLPPPNKPGAVSRDIEDEANALPNENVFYIVKNNMFILFEVKGKPRNLPSHIIFHSLGRWIKGRPVFFKKTFDLPTDGRV